MTENPDKQPAQPNDRESGSKTPEADKVLEWMGAHKVLSSIGGVVLLFLVIVAISGFIDSYQEDSKTADDSIAADKKEKADKAQQADALVAKAEKIAADELPDTPFWAGTTFKGTYVNSKKVCLDRVMGDGSNGGFVNVSFPEGTIGKPQDGTCAKPAPNFEKALTKEIKDKLGKSNRDVKRLESAVYNDDAGLGAVVVRWAINDNLTEGLTKKSAKLDISEMLEVIQDLQKDGLNVKKATFSGTFPLTDNLGDTKELKVVNATYSGATIKKINFDNFLNKNVYEIADSATIHPAFED